MVRAATFFFGTLLASYFAMAVCTTGIIDKITAFTTVKETTITPIIRPATTGPSTTITTLTTHAPSTPITTGLGVPPTTMSTPMANKTTGKTETGIDTACEFNKSPDGYYANCYRRQLTSVPRVWPGNIVRLDMSGNDVTKLCHGDLDQPELRSLRYLDLSHNKLKGRLGNETFTTVPQLKVLLLRNNRLQGLQSDAMKGLTELIVLDLSSNSLKLDYDAFPPDVFQPLASLRELYLIDNDDPDRGYYPDQIFLPLGKLTNLSIDTFPYCAFDGVGFRALRNLRSLKLQTEHFTDGRLKIMKNDTLVSFRNSTLEELAFGSPHFLGIETCALCELPHLKVLRATGTIVNVKHLLAALYGIQHQNMTLIDFSDNQSQDSVILKPGDVKYLHTICVSQFIASSSHIQRITNRAIYPGHDTPFFECLEHLDLSSNRVTADFIAAYLVIRMKSIKTIHMQKQYVFSMETAQCQLGQDRNCHYITRHNDAGNLTYYVSPSLQFLNISAAVHRLGAPPDYVIVKNASSLTALDMSFIKFSNCVTTILGLSALEVLDLSGNYCYNLSKTIFDTLPAVRHLRMSNIDLNLDFFFAHGRRLFKELSLLESVDLSFNRLTNIDPLMFSAQQTLRQISLARNSLEAMSLDLSATPTLEVLDLSYNQIPTLSSEERRSLDRLASARDFSLRLRGNPLLCACSNLDFLQWLWVTRVRLDEDGRGRNYTCVLDTGQVTDIVTVLRHYDYHWRRCMGPRVLGAAMAAFLLQLMAVLTTFIISRNWTHIRYMIKVMRHLRLPQRHQFRRDVYVGYADSDWELACVMLPRCLEQRHGVRLLLRGREELPGSVRAENIVDHIDDSWKVLLLVTRAFAEDEWLCGFTVQQAQRSITDTLPDRVLVLFVDDPDDLPPMASLNRLLRMVPERNVLHVRGNVRLRHPVWDEVARDVLGHPHRL